MAENVNRELMDRGHAALINALGGDGALQFLRQVGGNPRSAAEDDGAKRVLFQIDVGRDGVGIRFSQPVTWMNLGPEEAQELGEVLVAKAKLLSTSA